MDLSAWFGIAFLVGVAGAVYFLSRGVERRTGRKRGLSVDEFGRELGSRPITLAVPSAAAALGTFGLIGYLVTRVEARGITAIVVATMAGAIAAIGTAWIVAGWAGYAVQHDQPDERYVLQGHVARVVAAEPDRTEVEYTANGRRVVAPARSVSAAALRPGNEVVIERVEEGIVYVEAWSHVEQRL
jgi:hypothetical protein